MKLSYNNDKGITDETRRSRRLRPKKTVKQIYALKYVHSARIQCRTRCRKIMIKIARARLVRVVRAKCSEMSLASNSRIMRDHAYITYYLLRVIQLPTSRFDSRHR